MSLQGVEIFIYSSSFHHELRKCYKHLEATQNGCGIYIYAKLKNLQVGLLALRVLNRR